MDWDLATFAGQPHPLSSSVVNEYVGAFPRGDQLGQFIVRTAQRSRLFWKQMELLAAWPFSMLSSAHMPASLQARCLAIHPWDSHNTIAPPHDVARMTHAHAAPCVLHRAQQLLHQSTSTSATCTPLQESLRQPCRCCCSWLTSPCPGWGLHLPMHSAQRPIPGSRRHCICMQSWPGFRSFRSQYHRCLQPHACWPWQPGNLLTQTSHA